MLFPPHSYTPPVQIRVGLVETRECDRFNVSELILGICSQVVTPQDCIHNESKVDGPGLGYLAKD